MKFHIRFLSISVTFILLANAGFTQPAKAETTRIPAGIESASAPFPVTKVVLFTNGVGYFLREGTVSGTGTLELRFNVKDINDLLKSMVVRSIGGGKITGVNYASREPLEKNLKSFFLDLSENPSLASLLTQARGEKIELWAGERHAGTVIGIEERPQPETGGSRIFLNILGTEGLRGIPYDAITNFRFMNPKLNEELTAALKAIAEGRNTDKKSVLIRYEGDGPRRLQAGYVLEAPVWKTSYRLVAGEKDAHFLQGWAIVENTSDEDWKNVNLDLVSGMPVSFAMNLYDPLYNDRPFVPYTVQKNLQSRTYAGGVTSPPASPAPSAQSAPMRAFAKESAKRMMDRAEPEEAESSFDLSEGVSAAASGEAAGEFFRYTIEAPVDLPRRQSAMLPILGTEIEGARVSIYNEDVLKKNPMNGLSIKNTSGLSLMGGPLTVFEGGSYAGDARIDNLPPGGKRLISFSVDLDTEAFNLSRDLPETITRVRIQRGTLFTSKIIRKEKTYTFVNRGEKSRSILIEHPSVPGWNLIEPAVFEERTDDEYRFLVKTPAAKDSKVELRVVEEKTVTQTAGLSNMSPDTIIFYLAQRTISAAVREALQKLSGMKNELADTVRGRQGVEGQIQLIYREQERIRSNMSNLDRNSALYQRYLKAMDDQENVLTGLKEKLDVFQTRERSLNKAADDYLAELDREQP